jgi:small subunit ribosomal protein S16
LSVKIRLRRMGTKGKPFYRMVVAESSTARDGRFIDLLGYYDPRTEPATIKINEDKAMLWLNRGAQPTDTAEALLKKENIFQKFTAEKEAKKQKSPAAKAVEDKVVEEKVEEPLAPVKKRRTKASAAVEEASPAVAQEANTEPEAAV